MTKLSKDARATLIARIQMWIEADDGGQLLEMWWTEDSAEIMADAALTHVKTSTSFEKQAKREGWLE